MEWGRSQRVVKENLLLQSNSSMKMLGEAITLKKLKNI